MQIIKKKKKEECPYCVNSKKHARRHNKDDSYVVCLPHRIIDWVCNNAYNQGNVDMRNPVSADKYCLLNNKDIYLKDGFGENIYLKSESIENIYLKNEFGEIPNFGEFSVIATSNPLYVAYPYTDKKVIKLFATVIANVREGEYKDRRFATIFSIDGEWGLLDYEDKLHKYIGYGNIYSLIDTCVYGRATIETKEKVPLYTQREKCEKCQQNDADIIEISLEPERA